VVPPRGVSYRATPQQGLAVTRVPDCFPPGTVGTWGRFWYFSVNVLEIRSFFTDFLQYLTPQTDKQTSP